MNEQTYTVTLIYGCPQGWRPTQLNPIRQGSRSTCPHCGRPITLTTRADDNFPEWYHYGKLTITEWP